MTTTEERMEILRLTKENAELREQNEKLNSLLDGHISELSKKVVYRLEVNCETSRGKYMPHRSNLPHRA